MLAIIIIAVKCTLYHISTFFGHYNDMAKKYNNRMHVNMSLFLSG